LRPGGAYAEHLLWGPGPRATQAMSLGLRAWALLDGRTAPTREDFRSLAPSILRHRMALSFAARAEGQTIEGLIKHMLKEMA
ncbi:MAG: AAA family ATPase, partial [Pseudomonadota bacterium]